MDIPVGRLDLETSGLLILTNDTDFAEAITNPRYKVPKTYLVRRRRCSPTNKSRACATALN